MYLSSWSIDLDQQVNDVFFKDFEDVLKRVTMFTSLLIIMGDTIIQLDVKDEPNTLIFNRLLQSNRLVRHVAGPTQREGHTPDVLITSTDVTPTAILVEESLLSDHSFIVADVALQVDRGPPVVSVITFISTASPQTLQYQS